MKLYPYLCVLGIIFAADTFAQDAAKRELDKVQGRWRVVAAEQDGQSIPKEEIEKPVQAPPLPSGKQETPWLRDRILIKGNRITVGDPNGSALYLTIAFEPMAKATTVDLLLGSSLGDVVHRGIYSLKGDELTICCAKAGKDRPTKLTAEKGSGWTLLVLNREKR